MALLSLLVFITPIFLGVFLLSSWTYRPVRRLPPGPRKFPVLGNLLSMPSGFEWEAFQSWAEKYNSDILHLSGIGCSLIILNSYKAAHDLLEKRSLIYSGRPKFTFVNQIMEYPWLMPFMAYDRALKDRRRCFQRHFNRSIHEKVYKAQGGRYARRLLLHILQSPKEYMKHVRHATGGTMYSITYGGRTKAFNDPYINIAEKVTGYISESAISMAILFDAAPFLARILRPFLPGTVFKISKSQWKEMLSQFLDDPFSNVKKLMADGRAEPSFVTRSLEDHSSEPFKEEVVKDVASTVFIGGSSTTTAVLHTFFLAMLCFPEVQLKAQQEIDRVVGRNRLPDFTDDQHLPYVSALIKEVHRWRPAGPVGIPHFLEKDDEYGGYFIPGQSVVIANTWSMLHNEEDFPEPDRFNPERFLKNDGSLDLTIFDPASVVFGFGRRLCPGAHIAESLVWITVTSILSVFKISKAKDKFGNTIEPTAEYQAGMTFQPKPFLCSIEPRHDKAENLIRSSVDLNDFLSSKFDEIVERFGHYINKEELEYISVGLT